MRPTSQGLKLEVDQLSQIESVRAVHHEDVLTRFRHQRLVHDDPRNPVEIDSQELFLTPVEEGRIDRADQGCRSRFVPTAVTGVDDEVPGRRLVVALLLPPLASPADLSDETLFQKLSEVVVNPVGRLVHLSSDVRARLGTLAQGLQDGEPTLVRESPDPSTCRLPHVLMGHWRASITDEHRPHEPLLPHFRIDPCI
jgi:hypothetical protein